MIEIQEQAQKHFARLEEKYLARIDELESELKAARADTLDLQAQLEQLRDSQNTGQATLHRSTGLSNGPTMHELQPYLHAKLSEHSLKEVCTEVAQDMGMTVDDFVQRGF